ncbi:MAG: hypothetical protein EVJ46_03315 [Candidatus Acididesulfobacter guangdongensis]|uniref:TonB-dependent receptor n=1 Tax=Acididesulfobacter guangdongensis TaxID=2597225 RepID=A0A519BJ25_ACIG2|nr:MAG: hypothetical protein EVJ46_03315 [Candidatus Acididesulfobacter guangdongensis]
MHLKGVTLSLSIDDMLNKQYYAADMFINSIMLNNGLAYNFEQGLQGLPRFTMLTAKVKF